MLLCAAIARAETDPVLWRLLPPNPKAVISLDWKTLRTSHLGVMLREKFVDSNGAQAIPGLEFLDQVDRCIITSTGRGPTELTSDPAVLIVVRGHFDLAKVRQVLTDHGAKPQMFNSVQVYRPQNNGKDMAFVLLDPQTILIGDANSVYAAVDRNSNAAQPAASDAASNMVVTRAQEMDARYDVWAVMSGVGGGMSGDRLLGMLAGGGFNSDARSVEAGIALRNGLTADLAFIFPTEPEARKMASGLSNFFKALIKDKMGNAAMLDLEKRLKITADGAVARVSLRLNAQELAKNARIFAETQRQQPVQAAVAADLKPTVAVTPAPKPEPKVIRIEGLDDGPREIQMKPDHP